MEFPSLCLQLGLREKHYEQMSIEVDSSSVAKISALTLVIFSYMVFCSSLQIICDHGHIPGVYTAEWRPGWGAVQLECSTLKSLGGYTYGCTSWMSVYTFEREARLTTNPVWPSSVHTPNLSGYSQPFLVSWKKGKNILVCPMYFWEIWLCYSYRYFICDTNESVFA